MKELPGFVFASPETGQALVESCAAGCRFGSSLEPAVGIQTACYSACYSEISQCRAGEGADVTSFTEKQRIQKANETGKIQRLKSTP